MHCAEEIEVPKSVQVNRVPLGASGLQIPEIGVGVWQWGDRLSWGYGKSYSEADIRAAFEVSLARGLDFFDTAEVYGPWTSERLLGKLLHESRTSAIVASKFFPFPWRLTRGSLVSALKHSLGRLGLSSIDLYQIHWRDHGVPLAETMGELAKLKQEAGK